MGATSHAAVRMARAPPQHGRVQVCTADARIHTRDPFDRTCVRHYLTKMRTRISSKGQIVLPAEIRQRDRIEAGQEFEVERLDCGEYRLTRLSAPPNEGLVDWLLACPEKDIFIPIESESTDAL
jgi:AbrB family looped-hinge helix DNA binding protein